MTIQQIKPEDTWRIRQRVMWPDKSLEFVKLEDDYTGTHYGFFEKGELCSVVSCFERGGELQFRKLATLEHQQRKGYAAALLHFILDEAKRKGMKRIWCNARVNKKGYYEKFGFKETGNRFSKDGIDFTIMDFRPD